MDRYFVIVSKDILYSDVPANISRLMHYDQQYRIIDIVNTHRELSNGTYVISAQIVPNELIKNKCVHNNITDEQYALVCKYWGEENLFGLDKYQQLTFANERK